MTLLALPNLTPPAIPEASAAPQITVPQAKVPAVTGPAVKVPAAKPAPKGKVEDVEPDPLLVSILSTRRAHGSVGDTNFRLWLHAELKKFGFPVTVLSEGVVLVEVDKKSTTLFSCHIDTCHGRAESDGSKQQLAYDPAFSHIFLADKSKSGCLGGDDGVGIYLMMKMIKAKVKGSYLFHTGEECGGIGSRAVLATNEKWLKGFERCVAFDRAVRHGEKPEVIISQGGTACASNAFGTQLVAALNQHPFNEPWETSHKGSFTDSKVYSGLISECVNVGCFYVSQHTANEIVDAEGVEKLLDACLKIKWQDLKASRTPTADLPKTQQSGRNPTNFGQMSSDFFDPDDRDNYFDRTHSKQRGGSVFDAGRFPDARMSQAGQRDTGNRTKSSTIPAQKLSVFVEMFDYSKADIAELIDGDPEAACDVFALLIAKYKGLKAECLAMEHFLGN